MFDVSSGAYDNRELEVLVPVAPSKLIQTDLTPRINILTGKRLGLFWNRKPNGDVLLSRFDELLKERYNDITIGWLEGKGDPAREAPTSAIKEAIQKCEAVILAAGD